MIIWDDFSSRVDWMHLVKGASTGFTVLVVGGLSAPIMSRVPVIGVAWLIITAGVAFVVAGSRIGDALSPAVHGAATAMAAYLLALPLVVLASGTIDLQQVLLTSITSIVVGAIAGATAARLRTR